MAIFWAYWVSWLPLYKLSRFLQATWAILLNNGAAGIDINQSTIRVNTQK